MIKPVGSRKYIPAYKGQMLKNGDWLKTNHGQTKGTTPENWISEGLERKQLTAYFGASDSEIIGRGIQAVFLGYFWMIFNILD